MSRIGKNLNLLRYKAEVSVSGQEVKTKGKLASCSSLQFGVVEIKFENGEQRVPTRRCHARRAQRYGTGADRQHGDRRFQRLLQGTRIGGRCYRAALKGAIALQLGFSHDVLYPDLDGVKVTREKPDFQIKLGKADKQEIEAKMAAEIRLLAIRQSPTRAKASVMSANTSPARKVRRSVASSGLRLPQRNRSMRTRYNKRIGPCELHPLRSGLQGAWSPAFEHLPSPVTYAQVIDDVRGVTLAAASTVDKSLGVLSKTTDMGCGLGSREAVAERAEGGRRGEGRVRPRRLQGPRLAKGWRC